VVWQFAELLCAQRGVRHGRLNLISMETHQPHRHALPGTKASKRSAAGLPHLHLRPAHSRGPGKGQGRCRRWRRCAL
jgi:CopG family nickel-responsive transcriptional regulator